MDSTPLTNYSDLVISRSISNLGIGGICVTSCTFKTYPKHDPDPNDMSQYGQCATVAIGGSVGNVPLFYINKRTYSDGVWTVEALDRCAFLDRRIVTTGWQQIQPATPTDTLSYDTATFISAMIEQCGLGNDSAIPYTETKIPCDLIDGQTYQSVLSSMALAYCGYFCCTTGSTIGFRKWSDQGSQTEIYDFSHIHDNGSYMYGSVKVTNGSKSTTYPSGLVGGGVPCLEINNNFAKADAGTNTEPYTSYSAIGNGQTFRGWSIDKAVAISGDVPDVGGVAQLWKQTDPRYVYSDIIDLSDTTTYPDGVFSFDGGGIDPHSVVGFRVYGRVWAEQLSFHLQYTDGNGVEREFPYMPGIIGLIAADEYRDDIFAALDEVDLKNFGEYFADEENVHFTIECSDRYYLPKLQLITLTGGQSALVAEKRITRVEARFVGSKMMLSMGQDIPQMGEIERRGLLQQRLDEAVSTQKTYKWLRPTYQDPFMVPTENAEKGPPTP